MFFAYTLYTTEEEDFEETGAIEEAMRNDEADAKAQEKMEMAEIVGEVDAKIKKLNGMREARQRKRNKKIQQRERLAALDKKLNRKGDMKLSEDEAIVLCLRRIKPRFSCASEGISLYH